MDNDSNTVFVGMLKAVIANLTLQAKNEVQDLKLLIYMETENKLLVLKNNLLQMKNSSDDLFMILLSLIVICMQNLKLQISPEILSILTFLCRKLNIII